MPYFDIANGTEVIQRWLRLKNSPAMHSIKTALRLEAELQKVFGFRSLEINTAVSGLELILVVNKEVYYLPRLGTGLSQFLVVLVDIAMAPRRWVCSSSTSRSRTCTPR